MATKVTVRAVRAGWRRRKTENAPDIGISMRQPALDQPVEHAVERYAVGHRFPERPLDLVMGQRRRRGS